MPSKLRFFFDLSNDDPKPMILRAKELGLTPSEYPSVFTKMVPFEVLLLIPDLQTPEISFLIDQWSGIATKVSHE